MPGIRVTPGFADAERVHAATLYWEAFGAKLTPVLGPPERAIAFFAQILDPDYALTARDARDRLLGLAGFKTSAGELAGGGFIDLAAHYGTLGAAWRATVLAPLERTVEADILLMDGICVAAEARGQGIGTHLLDAVKAEAAARGLGRVRLDVIDTNPRAAALYQRQGFVAAGHRRMGPFGRIYGFAQSRTMEFTLPNRRDAAN